MQELDQIHAKNYFRKQLVIYSSSRSRTNVIIHKDPSAQYQLCVSIHLEQFPLKEILISDEYG